MSLPTPYYEHDGITIYHSDCRDILPDLKVDLIVTDPPYKFSAIGGGLAKKRGYQKRIDDSFGTEFEPIHFLEATFLICKPYTAYWYCSKDLVPCYLDWVRKHSLFFNILTWHKSNPIPLSNNTFLPDTEYCIFMKSSGSYFADGLPPERHRKYWITSIEPTNGHPTPKPIRLMKYHIELNSSLEATILGPFMGSGTTLRAAKDLRRKAIGIEIEEKYCEIAVKRLEQEVFDFS